MTPPRHQLITTEDAASIMGVQPDTLRQWARRGHLTRYGSARAGLWDWRELEQLVTRRENRRAS